MHSKGELTKVFWLLWMLLYSNLPWVLYCIHMVGCLVCLIAWIFCQDPLIALVVFYDLGSSI